ncbi:hypothetical protein HZ994_02470 [Akkermansiaceae bacterium]|nr:hypothetical protein HZ994_02470 [Akkermansiaceae bacterium]
MKTLLSITLASLASALFAAAGITQTGSASWIRTAAPGTFDASTSDKLVVVVSGEHNFGGNYTGDCTAVTYNGQALSLAEKQLPSNPSAGGHGQTHSSIWYLDSPANYTGAGTIAVTCTGNNWVATAIGLSGTLPGVGSTAKVTKTSTIQLTTTSYGSMLIGAVGMGGQGNTASPLPGVTATSPAQAVTIGGLKIGSNWAGHAVARALVDYPSTTSLGFNTALTDVVTVGAVFKSASPAVPAGPVPTVLDVVPGQSVQLTWNNLLPIQGGDVWVDVWIGDSPSNLTKVVSADPDGLNLSSFTYTAPAPGTYHGRIDSYLNGSPTGTPHTGEAFSFTVDDKGLLSETWIGLRALASVELLQKEGIDVRPPNTSARILSSGVSNLPAPAGVRLRGLLTPDVTGDYTLYVAGSENSSLWFSSGASRFNKQRVAWHLETTSANEWGKFPTQKSAVIHLESGQSYYIEAQVMNSTGIGHISIGWKVPGASTPVAIPVDRLRYPLADPDDLNDNNLPDSWEIAKGLDQSVLPGALSQTGDPDKDGISNLDEYRYGSDPLVSEELANGLTRDTWASPGMGGWPITSLTSTPRFYDIPSETLHVPGIDDSSRGTQFGARYRGFLIAPTTGSYRFWITGNDEVQLWLSDGTVTPRGESQPRSDSFGKRMIAFNQTIISNVDWGLPHDWDRTPAQRSQVIHLVAGQPYYIEALHKQGWGDYEDHVSVAWQPPGQARALLPASVLIGNIPHPQDAGDDGLPDTWQTAKGLTEPAYTSVQRGQFGDPDADGLTNLQEYQYGTNPKSADTDGDGVTDYKELFHYHTDPLVSNALAPVLAAAPAPHIYASYTGGWTANPDGSLSAWDRRGEITYSFTLAEAGVHEITLTGAAIGDVRSVERLPIVLSVDSMGSFASAELVSNNGGQGTVTGVTPWLAAGTHTLTILHDNYRAARRLRIDSIQIHRLGGLDMDSDGIPDWIEANAAELNQLTRVPAQSRTSPASIEGVTQSLDAAVLTYTPFGETTPVPLTLSKSVNTGFFTDVPLSENGATAVESSFMGGLVEIPASIEWIPTNLFGTYPSATLHIRQGDSLRLDAWSAASPDGQPFTVTLDGTPLADANQSTTHTSGQPFAAAFGSAGTFTLAATHGSATSSITLVVHSADFGPAFSVGSGTPRTWTPASLDTLSVVEFDDHVILQETTGTTGPRKFLANVRDAGNRHVLARLPGDIEGAPSAILARGTVNGFRIAYLDQTDDAAVVTRYPDGTWLMSGSIVAVNLPPDILIRLRAHIQGMLFPDGSNMIWLDASDFDANGIATIYYEWSGTGDPKLCNRLQLFVQP